MRPAVSYIPYAKSSNEQTSNIITFVKFEEGNLLPETCKYMEIDNESNDYYTIAPLLSEKEMDTMSSGDGYDDEPISMDMLEDIRDGSQYHPIINRREALYKIRDSFKQKQSEWKGELLSTLNMGKGLNKVF